MSKNKNKEPTRYGNYWADYVHLDNGRMIPVVEGFETLEEACEFVDKCRELGVLARLKPRKP